MPEDRKIGPEASTPSPEQRLADLEIRVKRAEGVCLKLIGQLAGHQHLPDGKPAIAIELLNLQ